MTPSPPRTPPRRWPWLVSSALLLAAAAAAGTSTYLHWVDCRGSMLVATVFDSHRGDTVLSDACLVRMDGGLPYPSASREPLEPGTSELGAVAVVLAGLAWLPLLLALGWRTRVRLVATVPVVLSLVSVAGSWRWANETNGLPGSSPFTWLLAALEPAALAAAVLIYRDERAESGLSTKVRLALFAWGASALGLMHLAFFDYGFMVGFSGLNWDIPPGTGYPTAAWLAATGIGVGWITVRGAGLARRSRSRRPRTEPSTPELEPAPGADR